MSIYYGSCTSSFSHLSYVFWLLNSTVALKKMPKKINTSHKCWLFEKKSVTFAVGKKLVYSDLDLKIIAMKEIVYQKIRTQITRSKYGEVFMVSSFPKYNVEYVTKINELQQRFRAIEL